ncbi:MAG: HrpE/YscL family type III secretion apparatus protein [Lentisphaeria bacterium]|nr:HrpE/YscL family type III secretion apparatus protein [Victivallales bacterium]MCR4574981.1 HrpE/YscL family type III secretion apparatus protein [Lentisphaeria bacterium]
MIIIRQGNLQIETTERLVKRSEAQSIADAMELLEAVRKEAEDIRRQAQEEFETQRKLGYEKGLEEGKEEIAIQKLEQVEKSIDYLGSMENKIVEIVLTALKKCVAEIGDRELMVQVIQKAMQAVVRNQQQIALKVSPEMLPTVKERLNEILSKFPGVNYINLMEDSHLKGVSCVIETDAGNVEASLDNQLAAIEKTLRKCFNQ